MCILISLFCLKHIIIADLGRLLQVHKPKTKLNGPFAEQLGLELTPVGDIKVTQPFGETSMQGVFAVGDAVAPIKTVPVAAAGGAVASAGLAMQLQME